MTPGYPGHNLLDGTWRNAVLLRQFFAPCAARECGPNSADFLWCEQRSSITHPTVVRMPLATLRTSVAGVVGVCAKEEMGRVHASGHVTSVTDKKAVCDRPIGHLVRESVRLFHPSRVRQTDSPVTSGRKVARPKPAPIWIIRLLHELPESFLRWLRSRAMSSHVASQQTRWPLIPSGVLSKEPDGTWGHDRRYRSYPYAPSTASV